MTNTKSHIHTPIPWDINAYNLTSIIKVKEGPDAKGNTYVDGRHSVKIANVMGEDDLTWGERHANAEHIVRCVNAHDDLVAALREAISDEEARLESIHLNPERYNSKTIPYFEERVERWKIALAKAKAVQ